MKTVSMSGSPRENVGKKDAKKNRREGRVPCVLYGGKEQVHFSMLEKDFTKIVFTPEVFIINIKINGDEFTAILQDIQYHPVTDVILHADFLEVSPDKPIIIGMPVIFQGNPPGVLKGGRLVKKSRKLKVKALMEDLPDNILLNISKLEIGDSIKVKDVSFKNLEFLDNPNGEIVGVKTARAVVDELEEEEDEEGEGEAAEGEGEGEGEGKGEGKGKGESKKEGEAPASE